MNFFDFDNVSMASSMPSLEPCSPTTTGSSVPSAGPNTPYSLSDSDDDVVIITDRTKLDLDAASARLRQTGQYSFMINACPTADRAARLFLQFHVADTAHGSAGQQPDANDENMRTFRINWRWLRGLVYADDRVFWPALSTDLDPTIVPDSEHRFAFNLSGVFTRCALDTHDLDNNGGPPRDCPHATTDAQHSAPTSTSDAPAPEQGQSIDSPVPLLPFHAITGALSLAFKAGTRAFRRFYHTVDQECVTVSPNWLSTAKLVEFSCIPRMNERTPKWVKEHCSEWVVKEVITCNGGNLCGIDYKLRLIDEIIWLRDDCLEWITGAVDAVRAFWAAGHCLHPDIAEKFLHQRPTAYCSLEWDAALLDWATKKVNSGHAYRIVTGRVRTAM